MILVLVIGDAEIVRLTGPPFGTAARTVEILKSRMMASVLGQVSEEGSSGE